MLPPDRRRDSIMIFEFTPEEKEQRKKLLAVYAPEEERLRLEMEAAKAAGADKATISEIHKRQMRLVLEIDDKLTAFDDKCMRRSFEPIRAAGADAIIANAREQAPVILASIHKDLKNDFRYYSPEVTMSIFKKSFLGTVRKGEIYLNANSAAEWLKEEFKLHLEALRDNEEKLQELREILIETAIDSKYTGNEEITDNKAKLHRRSPLADIAKYGIMNDLLNARILQDADEIANDPDGNPQQIAWSADQSKQTEADEMPAIMALTFEDIKGKLSKQPSAYDMAVLNAISNLWYYWSKDNPQKPLYVTAQEIWRRMNGKQNKDGSAKPSSAQLAKIDASVNNMRHIDIYLDFSAELAAKRINLDDERLTGGSITDYFLNCSPIKFLTERGRTVQGYRINTEPVLYTYNAAKKHVLSFDFALLDTSSTLRDEDNVTEFKQYLLQQILLMKNGYRDNKKILLDSLYKATGIKTPEERIAGREYKNENTKRAIIRREAGGDRDKIEKLLDSFKAKDWIKGYSPLDSKGKVIKKGERKPVHAYSIRI